jgi:ABC-type branched-subunit amino acid transport system substrate-binding protein
LNTYLVLTSSWNKPSTTTQPVAPARCLAKLGTKPVFADNSIAPDTKDMSPLLAKVKASGADVIVLHAVSTPMTLITKQIKSTGLDNGMHRALGDRFDSSVAFQTQYVRNKILSIAALDYKIRHGAMGGS